MSKKKMASRLREVEARLEELEDHLSCGTHDESLGEDDTAAQCYCSVPEIPEREFGPDVSRERMDAILATASKWLNGTNIKYYMYGTGRWGGDASQHQVVRRGFKVWKDVGIGLDFTEVSSPDDAHVRIGFLRGDGSWSYVGRDVLQRGRQERTMNFGWDINVTGPNGLDTAVHEIGHTLGLQHEHQNPRAGIDWNEEAVYRAFAAPPNRWARSKTHWNILRKIPQDDVEGSTWDPNSVMHYSFGRGLISLPAEYRNGLDPAPGLSAKDIAVIKAAYPPVNGDSGNGWPELKPFQVAMLSIAAGEQKTFSVQPTASRYFQFRTFGDSDTVMVLDEDVNGDFVHVKGDDDSGTNLNASFQVRLTQGRKYRLRIRLFYQSSTGQSAVMMW